MFSPISCYNREGSVLWQRKRKRSIFTARMFTRFWRCFLNRDVLSATVVFDTWSFLTPGKGKFLWLSENQKGLLIFSLSSTEHYLWSEFYSVVLSSVIQSLCHWVRIQKYPSSSSLQQLLYSALLVHTVIRFKNYTVFNTIFISNWNCCLFLFRWKSLHKVCKPGKATWWSIVCEETEYSR